MPNRLASETSPYLQQHADNPVEWYPWGEEALALARAEDKPILLSIGYSACHWCHVMAHESFEDTATAEEMNRLFVNIKVDREERPDLDQIYQTVHQMLTRRSGGWPLTMFLTPSAVPFFAGTYFPKTARYGMPAFKDLLARVAEAYRTQRDDIEAQSAAISHTLERSGATAPSDQFTDAPIRAVVPELARLFDNVHGGIGDKPKFPHPFELAFCLRRHVLDGGATAANIVKLTLTRMAEGGVFDQLGGGFCRYSTDRTWTIPHFEKMLYDNGPLLALYSDAWTVWRDPLYEKAARETAEWVLREMQSPEGGYYSSLDADSEGEEGKFYVWSREEVSALLSEDAYAVAAAHFGLDAPPNFEGQRWNLHIARSLADVAKTISKSIDDCAALIEESRRTLFAAREQRERPGRDEKILTSWNALMIKGMARAGRVFGRADWIESAQRAADFLRGSLWREARLLATYKDARAHLNAYLDDYAFLLDALLELMQTRFRVEDLAWAEAIAAVLLEQFEDDVRGGFYFTSNDHEKLMHRVRTAYDGATPSGNGIAAHALQRLGHVNGDARLLEAARRALLAFHGDAVESPTAHVTLITALEEALTPPRVIVIRGESRTVESWQRALNERLRPDTLLFAIACNAQPLPAALAIPAPTQGAAATVCESGTCRAPVYTIGELQAQLAVGDVA